MKKVLFLLVIAILALASSCSCSQIARNEEDIARIAREKCDNVDKYDLEFSLINKAVDHNIVLYVLMTNKDGIDHEYIPLEFYELKNGNLKFRSKLLPMLDRGGKDIPVITWSGGYVFVVNDTRCKTIRLMYENDNIDINIDYYPFMYNHYNDFNGYCFLDDYGNIIGTVAMVG